MLDDLSLKPSGIVKAFSSGVRIILSLAGMAFRSLFRDKLLGAPL